MDWSRVKTACMNELQKIATERKKPLSEKAIDVGAPTLAGAGAGKALADLSFKPMGASPKRKTIGALLGAAAGLGYVAAEKKKSERRKAHRAMAKTADPFSFPSKGMATQRFLSKPGKSISDMSPKIGRLGTLPKV